MPGAPVKPKLIDVVEYGSPLLEELGASARETRLLMESAEHLESSPAFDARLAAIEAFTQRTSEYVAKLAAGLILLFFGMLLLTRWISLKWLNGSRSK